MSTSKKTPKATVKAVKKLKQPVEPKPVHSTKYEANDFCDLVAFASLAVDIIDEKKLKKLAKADPTELQIVERAKAILPMMMKEAEKLNQWIIKQDKYTRDLIAWKKQEGLKLTAAERKFDSAAK